MGRLVIIFNIVVGIILIGGFAFVGFTLFQRSKQKNQEVPVLAQSLGVEGCEIVGTAASDNRLFVTLSGEGTCNRIVVLDAQSLQEVGILTP